MNGDRVESGRTGRKTYRKPELQVKTIEVGVYGTYDGDCDDPLLGWPEGSIYHGGGHHGGGRGGRGSGR